MASYQTRSSKSNPSEIPSAQANFQHSTPTSQAPSQRNEILRLLRQRGSLGATNVELNAIGFRYGARLWELRKGGFSIRTERLEAEGLFRFVLVEEAERPKPLATCQPAQAPSSDPTTLPLFAEVLG
jgi:hypothetical protein